jgi:ankyrin repeat protein
VVHVQLFKNEDSPLLVTCRNRFEVKANFLLDHGAEIKSDNLVRVLVPSNLSLGCRECVVLLSLLVLPAVLTLLLVSCDLVLHVTLSMFGTQAFVSHSWKDSPLHDACLIGSKEIAILLLSLGANVNAKTKHVSSSPFRLLLRVI